jgi:two-component system sensor histidine kinase PilS (NtrC family)
VSQEKTGAGEVLGEARTRALRQLVRYRLLVATISLPLGFFLGAALEETADPAGLLRVATGVAIYGGLTVLGLRWPRSATPQLALQIVCDLALVTWLAAESGGRQSQFVLFHILVILTAGMIFSGRGGTLAALGAALGYVSLPWLSAALHGGEAGAAGIEVLRDPSWAMACGLYLAVGLLSGVLGSSMNRSARRAARAVREARQVRLDTEHILASMSSGVLALAPDQTVLHANEAAADVLGIPLARLRGRRWPEALGAKQEGLLDLVLETLDQEIGVTRREIEVPRPDGTTRPVGLSTSILRDDDGTVRGVVAVFADLSEIHAAEERARRSETLAAIGQLSAAVAHEIRNAVVPLSGSVEILKRELHLTGENRRLLDLVSRECGRLNRFVSELLDYVRDSTVRTEPVVVGEVVREVLDLARRHPAAEGVEIRLAGGGEGLTVLADGEQLKRVFVNLAHNALEAMEGQGRLEVRIEESEETAAVSFADSGPGIPAEVQARMFEPFFTTKRGGTGLGLATAHRVLERLGGRLLVRSVPGSGTTVTVELPKAAATQLAA